MEIHHPLPNVRGWKPADRSIFRDQGPQSFLLILKIDPKSIHPFSAIVPDEPFRNAETPSLKPFLPLTYEDIRDHLPHQAPNSNSLSPNHPNSYPQNSTYQYLLLFSPSILTTSSIHPSSPTHPTTTTSTNKS
ncbi:hypothetical protein ONS95_000278 [Cadophora gregata]|uniref:uncharacterized protein n=1 Tax=Cadophora gregata TaxID=51156 RepID=UPI0026DC7043|nr:uncharacterized protein ONS95_000278 [Cadophora gregata]KAK0125720.1 hypothetical protein ONS96_009553 [Cadophora gregata f. sp. sojae]KAK0128304.1 hypothetical protein ONS95_000278 [Cadophora gregata]